jgi:hypothetical protein
MRITCPTCAKTLTVPDELAGRRVRCPGCQQPVEVVEVSAKAIVPGAKTAPPVGPPPLPRRDQGVIEPSRLSSRPAAPEDYPRGRCYIRIRGDEVNLVPAIQKRFDKLIRTEELDLHIMNENERPPADLGPADVVIHGEVTRCDYGNQFVRYFLTFISMFGPGSCQLDVDADVETAEGNRRVGTHARRWAGLFGGSGSQLMKENAASVATQIANGAARFVTGHRFLNAQVYSCANWSLGLGLVSLLPFVGVPFGLAGLIVSLVALLTINARGLPQGRNRAITGLVLPFLGFIATAGLFLVLKLR